MAARIDFFELQVLLKWFQIYRKLAKNQITQPKIWAKLANQWLKLEDRAKMWAQFANFCLKLAEKIRIWANFVQFSNNLT